VSAAEQLARGAAQLQFPLDVVAQEKLLQYLRLLGRWNKTYNLTALREERQIVSHHLLDSLSIIPYLWAGRWLDVGSGAGLPGIVLAITRSDWEVSMIDSNTKKTSFIQQAIIELGLENAHVVRGRVEDFKSENMFDGVISRAFSDLGTFLRLTKQLVSPKGKWAAMKGAMEKEVSVLPGGCYIEENIQINVPEMQALRSLVIVACEER